MSKRIDKVSKVNGYLVRGGKISKKSPLVVAGQLSNGKAIYAYKNKGGRTTLHLGTNIEFYGRDINEAIHHARNFLTERNASKALVRRFEAAAVLLSNSHLASPLIIAA